MAQWETSLPRKEVNLRATRKDLAASWQNNQVYQLYCWSLERSMEQLDPCDGMSRVLWCTPVLCGCIPTDWLLCSGEGVRRPGFRHLSPPD